MADRLTLSADRMIGGRRAEDAGANRRVLNRLKSHLRSRHGQPSVPVSLQSGSRLEHLFPTLTAAHVARIAGHGSRRQLQQDEVVYQPGDQAAPFLVVLSGQIEIVRPSGFGDTLITALGPGQFTGEANMLSGRRSLVRVRATVPSEVVQLSRAHLLALVQTDAELTEIIMRAFILRRVELIARGLGDVVLVGSVHSPSTLRIKEFLTRNGHPYAYIDLERDADVQELLDRFHVAVAGSGADLPLRRCPAKSDEPGNRQLPGLQRRHRSDARARCRGRRRGAVRPGRGRVCRVGGLDVLVVESNAPGGQAGASSKIENYLGFPTGISGQELAGRAYTQAQRFGAEILIAKGATQLSCDRQPYAVQIEDGPRVPARTVIIATGAEYRRPPLDNLSQFEGAGVYYWATFVEAQLCGSEEVIVVGGGNSAGQAAVFLSQTARHVHVCVRAGGLADSMSRYLVRRIEENPAITLHTRTEIVRLEGDHHLERVQWRHNESGRVEAKDVRHVFLMTGAVPNTSWLGGCVALDAKEFIKTGSDLSREELAATHWPLTRPPYLLETSLPGVFAVGDVRAGNVKRVASAVGEGSIAITFAHRVLHE